MPGYLEGSNVVARAVDPRDVPGASLVLGQLREHNLPVAAAVFCEQIKAELSEFQN